MATYKSVTLAFNALYRAQRWHFERGARVSATAMPDGVIALHTCNDGDFTFIGTFGWYSELEKLCKARNVALNAIGE